MTQLFLGISIMIFVYIIGWHQLYGQFINEFFKKYQFWLAWVSVPNTILAVYAAKILTEYFNGKIWPNRILSFSVGIIMFTLLTQFYFNEKINYKTLTLICLSGLIVLLQIIWN
jgi:hypothetical protein